MGLTASTRVKTWLPPPPAAPIPPPPPPPSSCANAGTAARKAASTQSDLLIVINSFRYCLEIEPDSGFDLARLAGIVSPTKQLRRHCTAEVVVLHMVQQVL